MIPYVHHLLNKPGQTDGTWLLIGFLGLLVVANIWMFIGERRRGR